MMSTAVVGSIKKSTGIFLNYLNKNSLRLMKSFLNFAGIESNKIHYTKLFLENYLRMQEGTLSEALHYEVQRLDLQENLLPPIDPNELIPFTRIDFIMDHIEDFYESNREKARARSKPETQVYMDCL